MTKEASLLLGFYGWKDMGAREWGISEKCPNLINRRVDEVGSWNLTAKKRKTPRNLKDSGGKGRFPLGPLIGLWEAIQPQMNGMDADQDELIDRLEGVYRKYPEFDSISIGLQ